MSKMFYLPTYEECEEIISKTPSNWFYRNVIYIDGYKIVMYNYILAWYEEFIRPIPNSGIKATELRGLVFVFNTDGSLYKRYIQLNKFWNVNQVEETQINKLAEYEINCVYEKLDGSLISFIRLPNGKLVAKTKASFEHVFLNSVNEIINGDEKYLRLINDILDSDCVPFFEYMSLENKVVIDYVGKNLKLVAVRDLNTGYYLDIDKYQDYGVDIVQKIPIADKTIYDVVSEIRSAKGIEGGIIHFKNGYIVKIKSEWYFDLHKIVTDAIYREDIIIDMYLNNTIDDVISKIPPNRTDKIGYIENIIKVVDYYMSVKTAECKKMVEELYDGDIKTFSKLNYKNENFNYAKKLIIDGEVGMVNSLIIDLKKNTYHYSKARDFIKKWTSLLENKDI